MASDRSNDIEGDGGLFVGGVLNQEIRVEDGPLTLESFQEVLREFFWGTRGRAVILPEGVRYTHPSAEVRQETSSDNPEEYTERLKRKAETMYKYKFRFKGGGKRVDNMNFKFHCFVADSDSVEHHLFEAKNKGLVVQAPVQQSLQSNEPHLYDSAMPILKIFTSTSGFGIPKEYYSFFFLLNPSSSKMVKIRPLGFDKTTFISDWYFLAAGKFLTKDQIRKFFGRDSDTWRFYQRQSFLSKRRLLELVEVGENKNVYTGEVEQKDDNVRMVRLD